MSPFENISEGDFFWSIWAMYLICILVISWRMYAARQSGKYIRNIFFAFVISVALSCAVYAPLVSSYGGIVLMMPVFFLPLMLILLAVIFAARSLWVSLWLALSLLTPGIYPVFVVTKAKGVIGFLTSAWAAKFIGAMIFLQSLALQLSIFARLQESPVTAGMLAEWGLNFLFWGVLVLLAAWGVRLYRARAEEL